MKRVGLYGNCINDTIHFFDEFKLDASNTPIKTVERSGGIFNVKRALSQCHNIQPYMAIGRSQPFHNATIFVDGKTKTSIVDWEQETRHNVIIKEAAWSHIAYIDKMPWIDKDFVKELRSYSIVSLDFCNFNDAILPRLQSLAFHISYIFISEEQLTPFLIDFCSYHMITIISHSPQKCSMILGRYQTEQIFTKKIYKDNVGAGDYFAAGMIHSIISNICDEYTHMTNAYNLTCTMLDKQNDS